MKDNKYCFNRFCLQALVLAALALQTAFADTFTVTMSNYHFSPKTINIHVGDTIIWTNSAGSHTVTGLGDEPMCGQDYVPVSCSETFTNAGSFAYVCLPHATLGMTGLVTVAQAAGPPLANITSPANGTVFAAPANFTFAVNATAASAIVTNVDFFINTNTVGSLTNSPFNLLITNLGVGQYTLTAVAYAGQLATTSAPVTITAIAPSSVSNSMTTITNGTFSFLYTADPGLSYVVQSSLDLVNWSPLATNLAATNPVRFTDTFETNGLRFYRVGRVVNP